MISAVQRVFGERKWLLLMPLFVIAPFIYEFVGFAPMVVTADGDGIESHLYALSLLAGHGYTMDGVHFSTEREPVYPFFLALLYKLFGIENLSAVFVVNLLLMGLTGALVYFFFLRRKHPYLGVLAGLSISLLPSLAIVAHDVAAEALFTLLLACLFLLAVQIFEGKGEKLHLFLWFGILCGVTTLVRSQVMFFIPFLAFFYLVLVRPPWKQFFANTGTAFAAFLLIAGSWMVFVHSHDGHFAITEGRPERGLYVRARRAELSYVQITHYAYEYLKQSVSGGHADDFFWQYDAHQLDDKEYHSLATTTEAVARLRQWSIRTIIANPGHYLYGNLIELMKLNYMEHDYSDTLNRYFRAAVYLALYALFLIGGYQYFRFGDSRAKSLMLLTFLFILYNWLVLTPFDTVPRHNIPYLPFYVIVGFLGIALWLERRKNTKGNKPQ